MQQYYNLVGIDSYKARNEILKLPYKSDPYLLSCLALTYKDEAMFFKNGNKRKRFLNKKLLLAKKYIDKSYQLNSDCRDVLFTKGEIYNALGYRFDAIDCFIKIIEQGTILNKKYNCSESDKSYIEMIVNDAHFQLYRLFKITNNELANKFLRKYKTEIKKGVNTIYVPFENFR